MVEAEALVGVLIGEALDSTGRLPLFKCTTPFVISPKLPSCLLLRRALSSCISLPDESPSREIPLPLDLLLPPYPTSLLNPGEFPLSSASLTFKTDVARATAEATFGNRLVVREDSRTGGFLEARGRSGETVLKEELEDEVNGS